MLALAQHHKSSLFKCPNGVQMIDAGELGQS
jgi:hypothetical protein